MQVVHVLVYYKPVPPGKKPRVWILKHSICRHSEHESESHEGRIKTRLFSGCAAAFGYEPPKVKKKFLHAFPFSFIRFITFTVITRTGSNKIELRFTDSSHTRIHILWTRSEGSIEKAQSVRAFLWFNRLKLDRGIYTVYNCQCVWRRLISFASSWLGENSNLAFTRFWNVAAFRELPRIMNRIAPGCRERNIVIVLLPSCTVVICFAGRRKSHSNETKGEFIEWKSRSYSYRHILASSTQVGTFLVGTEFDSYYTHVLS